MYIAMNRFKITIGSEEDFESVWKNRDSHLLTGKGFVSFNLLKGATIELFTLYASHTTWKTKNDFLLWTKSEAFRQAHKGAGGNGAMYLGHPEFEGFDTVL